MNNLSVYVVMWLIYFFGLVVDDEFMVLCWFLVFKELMGFFVFLESNVQWLEFRYFFNCWEYWV